MTLYIQHHGCSFIVTTSKFVARGDTVRKKSVPERLGPTNSVNILLSNKPLSTPLLCIIKVNKNVARRIHCNWYYHPANVWNIYDPTINVQKHGWCDITHVVANC